METDNCTEPKKSPASQDFLHTFSGFDTDRTTTKIWEIQTSDLESFRDSIDTAIKAVADACNYTCERCGKIQTENDGGAEDKLCIECWDAENPQPDVARVELSPELKKANLQNWLAKRTPPDIEDHKWHHVPLSSLSTMDLRVIIHIMYVRAAKLRESRNAIKPPG